jgi:type IV secretion system protein VirB11
MTSFDNSILSRRLLDSCGIYALMASTGTTEVAINRPGEAWTEDRNGWTRHEMPEASLDKLMKLGNALSVFNKANPALSAAAPMRPVRLPDGERGQIVIPPACEPDTISMTIRIPSNVRFTIQEMVSNGSLDGREVQLSPRPPVKAKPIAEAATELDGANALTGFDEAVKRYPIPSFVTLEQFELDLLAAMYQRDMNRFFSLAIEHGLNVVLVGGTGSGKTTVTKALADLVPASARVATIEDTHELPLPYQPNHVHMFFSDALPAREIVKSTLRMKFDRVYLAELRGDETWDYLRLLNTGHKGGMTTVHANDCWSAVTGIATLVKQSPVGQTLDYEFILNRVRTTVDIVLFMHRKQLVEVYYDPVAKWKLLRGLA